MEPDPGVAPGLRMLLPLPLGEGWGEGARSAIRSTLKAVAPTPTLPQRRREQFRPAPQLWAIERVSPGLRMRGSCQAPRDAAQMLDLAPRHRQEIVAGKRV